MADGNDKTEQQKKELEAQKLEFEVAASEDGEFYVIDPRSCFKLSGKTTS